ARPRALLRGDRARAQAQRRRPARRGDPLPAGRQPGLLGARSAGDAPRPRPDDPPGGRRAGAPGARGRRDAPRGAAGGVARQGLRRRHPRRPHLRPERHDDRRGRLRARRGPRRALDAHAGHGARGRDRHEAQRDDGALDPLREPARDLPRAARADRLGGGARAHARAAVRRRVLRAARRPRDRARGFRRDGGGV
ncbi:MAG: hypothetical protein AVDCRST_MAG30-2316, partial [uncultured Solirubrobacteraceae bacterium]